MQERVTPYGDDSFDVVVEFGSDLNFLGIGLEPRTDIPSKHFIDQLYGNVPDQTMIGKIFWNRTSETVGDTMFNAIDFQTSDQEAQFYNQLGRAILDAVTGCNTQDGLWTWLDRPASNRLIRLIRKGRDLSFGRDE